MDEPTSLIFAGVGGQGVLLIAEITARSALRAGHEAKQTEVHGVSQRGGSVESHVRFGAEVRSPLVMPGQADVVVGLEKLEALRFAHFLRPSGGDGASGGVLLANDHEIIPASVRSAEDKYPHHAFDFLRERGFQVVVVPASATARDLGDARMANVVLLGALSRLLRLPLEAWEETLRERLPERLVERNRTAFRAGREMIGP